MEAADKIRILGANPSRGVSWRMWLNADSRIYLESKWGCVAPDSVRDLASETITVIFTRCFIPIRRRWSVRTSPDLALTAIFYRFGEER